MNNICEYTDMIMCVLVSYHSLHLIRIILNKQTTRFVEPEMTRFTNKICTILVLLELRQSVHDIITNALVVDDKKTILSRIKLKWKYTYEYKSR